MRPEQIDRLLQAVPGFRSTWQAFTTAYEDEEFLPWYTAMSELAGYVADSYSAGVTNELPDLFRVVEELFNQGDAELENLLAVGFFEDLQNIASHQESGYSVFRQWLGERSRVVWDEVEAGMEQVAQWAAAQPQTAPFDVAKALAEVSNPTLRRILQATYRKKR